MWSRLKKFFQKEEGFSFIEIMIVVVIIGFLAAVVGPNLLGRLGQAKTVTAQNQVGTFGMALEQYYLDNGRFPTTEQGLAALRVKPTVSPVPNNWEGPYLQRDIPQDPWKNSYVYKCPGDKNPNGFDLYSLGRDGQEGGSGEDQDVTNWSNVE